MTVMPAEVVEAHRQSMRAYEIAKLTIISITLLFVVLLGVKLLDNSERLVEIGSDNRQALIILQCAVSEEVRVDEANQPRDDAGQRLAFDVCVKRGFPINPWPPTVVR